MIDYNKVLDRAKALLDAIEDNQTSMWDGSLDNDHHVIVYSHAQVDNTTVEDTRPRLHQFEGISEQVDALRESIKETKEEGEK